jgi:uncharacterized membrane protein YphA (DoxX/SURF4 family)
MFIAYAIVAIVLSLALLGSAAGKLTKNPKATEALTTVGVPDARWPVLAGLEVAGAIGLIIGLWVPALGVAAGVGVVLYFIGAVVAHLRADDANIGPALALSLVAVAAVVLRLISR